MNLTAWLSDRLYFLYIFSLKKRRYIPISFSSIYPNHLSIDIKNIKLVSELEPEHNRHILSLYKHSFFYQKKRKEKKKEALFLSLQKLLEREN